MSMWLGARLLFLLLPVSLVEKSELSLNMKTKLNISLVIVIALSAIIASCSNDDSGGTSDFLIKVDSIHCPDSVVANTRFDIEFFGVIGFNGCFSFKTFNQHIFDYDILIEAWGTYDNSSGICPDALVLLNGQKLGMTFAKPGIYRIEIAEPDNTIIIKNVLVKKPPENL
jgi:hypothetical protein